MLEVTRCNWLGLEPSGRKGRAQPTETGEPIEIAEATLPKFTPGKLFKDRVVEAHKPKAKPKKV